MHEQLITLKERYPDKFQTEGFVFRHIHRGAHIFISTGCAQPQYLVKALVEYVKQNPKAFFDTEVLHLWTLGVAPYMDEQFSRNFRHNSFYISDVSRDSVNQGIADYTPVFLSQVPRLFRRGIVDVDVALIQTSLPDEHGYVNLGPSVDIVKAAIDQATVVIAQMNVEMPYVFGDGFVPVETLDFIIPYDEPLLEYQKPHDDETIERLGAYVAHLIEDGDTLQVGYGSTTNAVLSHLEHKQDLGIHTELLTDGIVNLMRKGVINNRKKSINSGRTVASFFLGTQASYDYIHKNPAIEFRTIDYTNNPSLISRQENIVAINGALQIDLTGQATAESLGRFFYSGIGGQADFMRGAVMARNGKPILTLPSTIDSGATSRIVPLLKEGTGVTSNRGDIHYVVTEHGIAYLHGKSIRERAMALIAIAHPDFRPWLVEEAKRLGLIFKDQAFVPGQQGIYPESLETYRELKTGQEILLRPVKLSDEPLLKDFFYSLSDQSLYRRFMSQRQDMPHERLQEFVVIDYTQDMIMLAVLSDEEKEEVIGMGEYYLNPDAHTAEASFSVQDDYQGQGLGTLLLQHLVYAAKRQGLLGFTADVLFENMPMLRVFEKVLTVKRQYADGAYELTMMFRPK